MREEECSCECGALTHILKVPVVEGPQTEQQARMGEMIRALWFPQVEADLKRGNELFVRLAQDGAL